MLWKVASCTLLLLAVAFPKSNQNESECVEHSGHPTPDWESFEDLKALADTPIDKRAVAVLSKDLCAPFACYYATRIFLRKEVDFLEVVEACNITGSNQYGDMLSLKNACRQFGFRPRAMYVPTKDLTAEMLPAILYLDKPAPHFELGGYMAHDGCVAGIQFGGIRAIQREELDENWSGYLLMLDPPYSQWVWLVTAAAIAIVLAGSLMYVRATLSRNR